MAQVVGFDEAGSALRKRGGMQLVVDEAITAVMRDLGPVDWHEAGAVDAFRELVVERLIAHPLFRDDVVEVA